jgi:hypothetical protein
MALQGYQHDLIIERYYSVVYLFYQKLNSNESVQKCFNKWAGQLKLNPPDPVNIRNTPIIAQPHPATKSEKISAVYYLMLLICMDQVVQEEELEIAEKYAQAIGLKFGIIREIFDALLSIRNSELTPEAIEAQIITYFENQPA